MYGGGGANQPLTNSLNTLNTLKNSNPKELSKNLNKIQNSNQLDLKIQDSKKSTLQSLQKDSKIQSKTISKIGISIIASVLLSQNLVAANLPKNALPSGGKFTHGSGSIKVNGKEMNITGNNTNHIIAWGGGFNIGKDAEVNFDTSHGRQASFLNLDYTNKASQILGNLNGNGNNIYLVNPSGVLIGQNASINANKFVASNTIDDKTLNSFKTQTKLVETFSPVFKPNKGNIVNLGTIKANNGITLIGDTIDIRGGKIENTSGGINKDDSIYFVGENIYIDADAVNLSSNNNIYATAFKEGYIQRQMKNFQKDNFSFISNGGTLKTDNIGYDYFENGTITNNKIGQKDFKKAITLGNGNADEALSEWYWFANGWNNNNGDTRSVDEFRLVGDIDFSKQLNGKDRTIIDFSNNGNNKTYTGNYAAPTNNGNGNLVNADYSDTMIVGEYSKEFSVVFDGSGYTLGNVDIDTQIGSVAAIFGSTNTAEIKNFTIDTIDIDSLSNSAALVGWARDSYISNINVKNVNINGGYNVGGLIGSVHESQISNIAMSNIKVEGLEGAGGLTGFVGSKLTISDITLSDLWVYQKPERANGNNGGAGGLIGVASAYDGITIENVVLNQIHEVVATFDKTMGQQEWASAGGLVGRLDNRGPIANHFENIILNGIGKIEAKEINNLVSGTTYSQTQAGGFIGSLNDNSNTQNVYLYFNDDSTIKASGGYNHQDYVGKFYGYVETYNNPNVSLNNVNLYYNDNPSPSLANPIKDADSSNSTYYNQTINPTTPETNKINLYTYSDSAQGIKDFQTALEQQNNSGGAFETNKIVNIGDDSNPIYSFEQTTGSNITPPTDSNTPNIDLGDVTLDSSDFDVSILQTIINDILNEKYALNIEDIDEDKLNSSNILETLAYLLGIDYSLLEKDYESLSPKEQESYQTLHSLKQSLDFYTEFNKGESDGLKSEFEGWFGKGGTSSDDLKNIYQTSLDKHSYISESLTQLRDYVNGEGSYNGNGLINQISSINNNLKALESLKQKIKAAQKYYQEALEAKLPYETLEGIYNEMVKIIDESYAKAQSLLNTLESEDKVYLTNLLREYSIKENSGFDDITGTFTFNGENLQANLDKTILAGLSDKPNLTPPTKEEVGDDPTKENNPDVPNNLQKIADLASKEAILILPAQEKQEAIVEDGKERGRLCIVSDNAKTNNPCMAIT
ncbi:filamentous hemagglutinin N-terminal domain-containing protein, partial [Helicobacter pullorum]|uniref:filamentous hemagglutinin N-terminal domain-containing protein n=2 Tax=Helicobacter pullorum TaxID=35818 RepID=UPI001DE7FC7F